MENNKLLNHALYGVNAFVAPLATLRNNQPNTVEYIAIVSVKRNVRVALSSKPQTLYTYL